MLAADQFLPHLQSLHVLSKTIKIVASAQAYTPKVATNSSNHS